MNEILEFENNKVEYKSLKKVFGKNADLKNLAKSCMCMVNAQGGGMSHLWSII